MEIAFLVIAVIGLLALTGGGSFSGNANIQPGGGVPGVFPGEGGGVVPPAPVYVAGAATPPQYNSAYTPTPASQYVPPNSPSTGAAIGSTALTSGAAIGGSALVLGHLGIAASAVPVVGIVISAVAAVAAALLAAHEKRLTGAKNENEAVDQWIPVFDSFVTSVVNAYNNKTIDAYHAAMICQQFDQTLYSKFRGFVGQPGTAWNDSTGMQGKCDTTCTVGCCVYFGDLGPVLNNISYVLGYPTGKWGQGDPRINGRTITCPKVYPSKYSSYSRDLYTVTLS
jgi:hypothetical protein